MKKLALIDERDCTDPAVNLAMEEYVLRYLPAESDYFLLYRNEPSVIVGRNQNVLEEVDDFYIREKGIGLYRRISGGGAVYHDLGNLNFSFITRYESSRLHNFRFFNEPLIKVLRTMGVPAEMNDRNDIIADNRKISGNAQFSTKGRMVSHGTLLFDSDLTNIDRTLTGKMSGIQSKSHKSVRSTTANISEFITSPISIQQFRAELLEGMLRNGMEIRSYVPSEEELKQVHDISNNKYRSWEWNIGRNPRFRLERTGSFQSIRISVQLEVDKGVIVALNFSNPVTMKNDLAGLEELLTGIRYDPEAISRVIKQHEAILPDNISRQGLLNLLYSVDSVPIRS